jgi:acetolactate synthase I/II/III large subunit
MKMTGAQLVRHALEQLGVRFTFGIPGVHNTEIYDQLASSEQITPIRVTHEGSGAFMADAVSRTSDGLGTLMMVPAAGTALAYAGMGEAFLDGIPMLVVTGGIRNDHGFGYQLHEIDQLEMVRSVTKGRWRCATHAEIVPTLFEAWRVATEGEPGPVFVEVPVNLQLFPGEVPELPKSPVRAALPTPDADAIERAAKLLAQAKRPGIFLGWGARDATQQAIALAERLNAPVATTLQGLSVFPASHPLHVGMGIGPAAVPAATHAFADCDVLLAVGNRFGEIATGSFGLDPRWALIHADINPQVFNVNYQAEVTIAADAALTLGALLRTLPAAPARHDGSLRNQIAQDKQRYLDEWLRHDSKGRVNPARFFQSLRRQMADDAYLVADDGNHTFLVAELFAATRSKHVFSPTDFNCMGYCVPAAIGVKLANPKAQVVGVVGDGAFLMTALEMLTATEHSLGIVYYVFNDGELSQISQAQALPYNRKACTVLPEIRLRGIADAVGAGYFEMASDADIERVIESAEASARGGKPVVVDVRIDYSKPTRFTQGIVKTNLGRMDLGNKLRMIGRAAWRRVSVPD